MTGYDSIQSQRQAYDNWLAQKQAYDKWLAQKQAYDKWLAQKQAYEQWQVQNRAYEDYKIRQHAEEIKQQRKQQRISHAAQEKRSTSVSVLNLRRNPSSARQAVILSEIIGKPVSKRRGSR